MTSKLLKAMAIEFTTLTSLVSGIKNGVKEIMASHEQAKVNEVAISLQGIVLDLQQETMTIQSQYMGLLYSNDELKRKLAVLEDWDKEKARYELTRVGKYSIFVRALKRASANGEPAHWLCAGCFDNGKKSILQAQGSVIYQCNVCKQQLIIEGSLMLLV